MSINALSQPLLQFTRRQPNQKNFCFVILEFGNFLFQLAVCLFAVSSKRNRMNFFPGLFVYKLKWNWIVGFCFLIDIRSIFYINDFKIRKVILILFQIFRDEASFINEWIIELDNLIRLKNIDKNSIDNYFCRRKQQIWLLWLVWLLRALWIRFRWT